MYVPRIVQRKEYDCLIAATQMIFEYKGWSYEVQDLESKFIENYTGKLALAKKTILEYSKDIVYHTKKSSQTKLQAFEKLLLQLELESPTIILVNQKKYTSNLKELSFVAKWDKPTYRGHFIVATQYDENNNIHFLDPNPHSTTTQLPQKLFYEAFQPYFLSVTK